MIPAIAPCNLRKIVLVTLAASALMENVSPNHAMAQGILEEVIVTARKRAESLQETPVAVSALSGAQLEEVGLADLVDLTKVVPNLQAKTTQAGGFAQLAVRGVGARNSEVNFDGGVAVYQDGVYLSRPDGNLLDNVDIQSVQVLRGPQGTLFGKNSTGGAILYTTNRPAEEFEGHAEIEVGNKGRLDGEVTVNLPLVKDLIYSRFSLFSTNRDGWVEDQLGRELSDVERYGGQIQFRILGGDSVVVDINSHYSKTDQAAVGLQCRPTTGVPGAGWQSASQDPAIVVPSTGKTILEHCQDAAALGKDNVLSSLTGNLKPTYESETKSLSANLDWEINDALSFRSISAWRTIEASQNDDIYAMEIPLLNRVTDGYSIGEPRSTDFYSQEFQLTGVAFDEKIKYVHGVFASNEQTDQGTRAGPTGPFFNSLNQPGWAFYSAQALELLTDNTSYAVFSHVEWSMTQAWNLTLGLRYTWEERKLTRNAFDVDVATLSTGAPASYLFSTFYSFPDGPDSFNFDHDYAPGTSLSEKIDNDDWNPMAGIQYLFEGNGAIDAGSAYFNIGTGFLSGGLSENLTFDGNLSEYDPEDVTNYELGVKLDAFDGTLRLNTALFYTRYDDRQLTSVGINPQTGTISSKTVNASKSTIAGLEIEATWLPLPNLELSFNAAFNDGDIDEFDDVAIALPGAFPDGDCETVATPAGPLDACNVDRSNEDLPNLPEQTYYAAGQYLWRTDIGSVIARLDAIYQTKIEQCFDFSSCLYDNGDGLKYDVFSMGARLTWLSEDAEWRVTAYGNNLTDERERIAAVALVGTTETTTFQYQPPRTYGVELAYTW
ncbi:MAG: TonB-dependent receptor [Gammaproteobacteria bacterium]|nr:TonB-dependent receptor [Gammaproteobacteria bacterium]